jgi:hypothetical protein
MVISARHQSFGSPAKPVAAKASRARLKTLKPAVHGHTPLNIGVSAIFPSLWAHHLADGTNVFICGLTQPAA